MADAIPLSVPREMAETARDTLGGARAVTARLSDQTGPLVLSAAREAFSHGLQITAVSSGIIVLSVAVWVFVLLRRVRSSSEVIGAVEAAQSNDSLSSDGCSDSYLCRPQVRVTT